MKHRVFAYVEDNSKKNKPDRILAVDEMGKHLFCYDVDNRGKEDYEEQFVNDRTHSPAAVAFAAFERFCKEECGIKDCNDEVILAEYKNIPMKTLADYVEFRLGGADWVYVWEIGFEYRFETAHLEHPMHFKEFRKAHTAGLKEPYATRALYAKYRELIHKDVYTEDELNRMEQAIFSRLDAAYRRRRSRPDASIYISDTCAAIYRGDRDRFRRVVERIVADYARRRSKRKSRVLEDILEFIADSIYCEGEIDLASLDEEEKKPPLERKEYAIFAALSPEALRTVKPIIEEWEKRTTS